MSEIYLGHFDLAATKLRDIRKAYEIVETARGRAIADSLRGAPREDVGGDPITRAAQQEVNRIQLALLSEANRNRREKLLERLFEAEQLLEPLDRPRTRLQQAVRQSRAVVLATLQKSLRSDEMVLEYVLSEPKSFSLYVTPHSIGLSALPVGRKAIEGLVENYLAQIRSKKPGAETGERLYSLLLRPVPNADSKLRLIIVPDGKLHLLPFDSLRDSHGRYVLTSHVVTYAPSATVLYLIRTSPVAHPGIFNFLAVGDVRYQRELSVAKGDGDHMPSTTVSEEPFDLASAGLEDLPMTRDEVTAASKVLGGKNSLLLGTKATEAAFKAEPLADFKIIHIAAHGLASTRFPDRAALVLATDPKSSEDGLLQSREIGNLSLNAELVTLSACDAGIGRLQGQEGIANLIRAFLFAGAKSVVASLWTASDVYTLTLMQRFYRHLAEGYEKGMALRQAKIESISEFGDQAVPFYWAGFTLTGEGNNRISLPRRTVRRLSFSDPRSAQR